MEKKVIYNYLYNLSYQILILILPFITTPYVSRVLGAGMIGSYSYTQSIVAFFILFGGVGVNLYGQREVAYVQENKAEKTKVFWELVILKTITMLMSLAIYIFMIGTNEKYYVLFLIQIIDIVAAIFDISWFFQGIEEFKKIVVRNMTIRLAAVILIFIFVKNQNDIYTYAFIYSISLFLGNLSIWLYIPRYIERCSIKSLSITRHIKMTLGLFIPQIAISLYAILDKAMIGLLTGNDQEVAFYEQAQKIIKMALALVTSMGTVMLSRIASDFSKMEYEKIKQNIYNIFRFVFFLALPICLGIWAITPNFVPLFYGEGFEKVAPNMILIAPIIIFVSLSNVIGNQYLVATQKQKEYLLSVIAGSGINFIINLILIPKYLSLGAAIATVIAEFSVLVVQLYIIRKDFKISYIFKSSLKYLITSVIMFLCIKLVSERLALSWGKFVVQISLGIVIYIALLTILKDKLIQEVIVMMKNKLHH